MEIKILKSKYLSGFMDQNTYLVLGKKEAILIDAGAEIQDIKNALSGRNLKFVLMTHLHFDHIWNLEKIVNEFNCQVFIQKGAENRFLDSNLNASFLIGQKMKFNIDKKYIKFYEKTKVKTDEFEIQVINTPGHTKDSVCLLVGDTLFSGDTLFAFGTGRTDLVDGDDKEMENSLKKLKELNYILLCPGHAETLSK